MKVRDVLQLLHQDGWTLARMWGRHRVLHHTTKPGIVIVVVAAQGPHYE